MAKKYRGFKGSGMNNHEQRELLQSGYEIPNVPEDKWLEPWWVKEKDNKLSKTNTEENSEKE